MENINFFEDIGDVSAKLLNKIIKHTPLASMVVNENKEVVYINNKLKELFKGSMKLSNDYFGNIFNCSTLKDSNKNCGAEIDCMGCKLNNAIEQVLKERCVINNIQIKQIFLVNNKPITKWFDLSLIPVEYKGNEFVWVAMMDLTDVMKYKIEAERLHMLNDEDNAIEKNRFHENVIECISICCHKDGEAFFILTELKDTAWIKENFGFLWKNEHLSSFYTYLIALLGPKDYACRYSDNEFLTFLPCAEVEDAQNFMTQLDVYNDKYFHNNQVLHHKIMKLKVDKKSVEKLLDEDELHIKYFKALSAIDNFDGQGVCEIIL